MAQVARNVTDVYEGLIRGKRYLLLDRDVKYSDAFRGIITRAGVEVVRLPPRSPNLNAFAERFVRSIKEECLNRMVFVGPAVSYSVNTCLSRAHKVKSKALQSYRRIWQLPTVSPSQSLLRQASIRVREEAGRGIGLQE
jgi:transposase InsO family protein